LSAVAQNLAHVRDEVERACRRAGRDPASVTICAVTKRVADERVREAVGVGLRMLGESRVQDAEARMDRLADLRGVVEWRLVGHLQRNKARRAAELFDAIESLDSVSLGEKLGAFGAERGAPVRALVEVNTSGEAAKSGLSLEGAVEAIGRMRAIPGLSVEGLMTMAPLTDDEKAVRASFVRLRALRDEAGGPSALPQLSMGMSADYPIAIEEGATIVRIGTALFV
jgi:pyridoxal phosphate enzyme (YggS family)